MKAIGFNTGRRYQADGQRISVGLSKDGQRVLFNDHSRGIWGELTIDSEATFNFYERALRIYDDKGLRDYELQDFAVAFMQRYDRNQYRMSSEAGQGLTAGKWPEVAIWKR